MFSLIQCWVGCGCFFVVVVVLVTLKKGSIFSNFFMCTGVLPVCISEFHVHARCPWRPEGMKFPGTGVTYGCKLPRGC